MGLIPLYNHLCLYIGIRICRTDVRLWFRGKNLRKSLCSSSQSWTMTDCMQTPLQQPLAWSPPPTKGVFLWAVQKVPTALPGLPLSDHHKGILFPPGTHQGAQFAQGALYPRQGISIRAGPRRLRWPRPTPGTLTKANTSFGFNLYNWSNNKPSYWDDPQKTENLFTCFAIHHPNWAACRPSWTPSCGEA